MLATGDAATDTLVDHTRNIELTCICARTARVNFVKNFRLYRVSRNECYNELTDSTWLYNSLMRGFVFEKIEFQYVFKGRVQVTEFIFNKAKLSISEYFS